MQTLPKSLDDLKLARGCHKTRREGMCAAEAIAWLAKERHSDRPKCLSPVLGTFVRSWNDAMNDEDRQKLKPYLERAISTSSSGDDGERAWLCTDWLVREYAPAWLKLAGLKKEAKALRCLPGIADSDIARNAQPKIVAARAAAGDAARAVAGDAARAVARAVARAAAGDAAWAVAGDAAWAAAWAAAGDAAWAAARAAARAAAGAAAGDAARAALDPTTKKLQESALELLDRMVKPV